MAKDEQEVESVEDEPEEKNYRVVLMVTDMSGTMSVQDISDEIKTVIDDMTGDLTADVAEIVERP